MASLTESRCEPCRGGVPPLTPDEVRAMLPKIPEWHMVERDRTVRIERGFKFADFAAAMAFAIRVADLAQAEDHHPELHIGQGRVRVETWTHKIRGLHRNDFIMAAKIDQLASPKD